jgi:hydrogenase nickel incorporation protein HypA/HybF
MHELSICENLVEIVREEMDKAGLKKLNSVRVKVGEFTNLVPDALQFCFEIATQETPFEGAVLEVELVPTIAFCNACQEEFHVEGVLFICPKCHGGDVDLRSGRDMSIESIDAD